MHLSIDDGDDEVFIFLRGSQLVKQNYMNPVEAKRRIIEEWLKRPANERREMNISDFYGDLISTGSSLLSFHGPTDRFERLKMWLLPHISQ